MLLCKHHRVPSRVLHMKLAGTWDWEILVRKILGSIVHTPCVSFELIPDAHSVQLTFLFCLQSPLLGTKCFSRIGRK